MSPDFVERARAETVKVADYDPEWPKLFEQEAKRLRSLLPEASISRIEHFGSTAVPGLAAKPIVDVLVEVPDLLIVHRQIAPILTKHCYEYFWRPGPLGMPDIAYTWFIRRDVHGVRTHHVHMISPSSPYWDRLIFRDWLRAHPDTATEYGNLKRRLARDQKDRGAYARAKGRFIENVLKEARKAPDGTDK
ncbi:MAG: GrpB family protein [Pseudomonadota bacterium]